jgi:hypothetical protein
VDGRLISITCLPMFNSYGLLDRVLTGTGSDSRPFESVAGLASALAATGIQLNELQDRVSNLDAGFYCEVLTTQAQAQEFFACSRSASHERMGILH